MSEYALTLALGLVISLALYDGLSIAAGGLIVPGYTAYVLGRPILLAVSLVAGLIAYVLLAVVGKYTILYGRRRFVMAILLGLLANVIVVQSLVLLGYGQVSVPGFGYVVPGLLAGWLDRQGVVSTFSALTIAATMTALVVMLLHSLGV